MEAVTTAQSNPAGPRRALLLAYTRLSEAEAKGLVSDDPSTYSLWYNPGGRFEKSVVFVPYGRQNLDIQLTPQVRYIELARGPGTINIIRRYFGAIWGARKLIVKENLDVIRVGGPNICAAIALPLKWMCPRPTLMFIEAFWEDILDHQAAIPSIIRNLLPLWYRLIYRTFDAYCGTPTANPNFYTRRGMNREKIAPWRNELDLAALDESTIGIPREVSDCSRPRLVAVGRLHPEKLTLDLLHVLSDVRRVIPTACLVLVGDGPLRRDIELLAQSLDIRSSVILTGTLSTKQAYEVVRACDVYVAVMQGSALVEAMAAGRPIVAYDNLPHRSYVTSDRNALLVEDRKPDKMASAVISLLKDTDRLAALGAEARKTAYEQYGPTVVADALYAGFLLAWRNHHGSHTASS